jgi:phytoene synthase
VNPDVYCQQKAAPPGSATYYAVRQAPAARRPLLTAWFALRRELEDTVNEVSDLTIGRVKLAWWRNESLSLAGGQPAHPVTRAMAPHLADGLSAVNAIQALIGGYENNLEQARYPDYPALGDYLASVGGTFAMALAEACAPPGLQSPPQYHATAVWAAPLGQALALAQIIPEVGIDARRGRIYVPIDEMRQFNVPAADLTNRRYTESFTALMQFEVQRARAALHDALARIPRREHGRQDTLRAMAALADALLVEVAASGYQVLHQRIGLTPLRRLWVAWRSHSATLRWAEKPLVPLA